MKLQSHWVEKPWGRTALPPGFAPPAPGRWGELWFEGSGERADHPLPLLVKYLFTSETLSVQVHPDDDAARAMGHPHGKAECWYIVAAEPDARLGLGLVRDADTAELRAAAESGAIEQLIDWKRVAPGELWSVPAGTIHAIGPGLTIVEIQQNIDLTYRFYDYGRPRALHLDESLAVAVRGPYAMSGRGEPRPADEPVLSTGHFDVWMGEDAIPAAMPADRPAQWVPMDGYVATADAGADAGECLHARPADIVALKGRVLAATARPPS